MQQPYRPVTYREFFNSPAFRQGFEDVRTAAQPRFDQIWGRWQVAYEIGRLVAAQALAAPSALPPLGVEGRIPATMFKWLKEQYQVYKFGYLDEDEAA